MKWFVLALFAALLFPSWSAALTPTRDGESPPPGQFLPGADLGVSPHATWEDGPEGPRLLLTGVAGARLVIDEAMFLRVDYDAWLEVRGDRVTLSGVDAFELEFRNGDARVGVLRLTDERPSLALGAARPGDVFTIGATLSIAPDAPIDGKTEARVWLVPSYRDHAGE